MDKVLLSKEFAAVLSATLSNAGTLFVISIANSFEIFPYETNLIVYIFPFVALNLKPWVT